LKNHKPERENSLLTCQKIYIQNTASNKVSTTRLPEAD